MTAPRRLPVRWALPAAAAAIYLAAVLVWVASDRRAARDVFPAGSVWNEGDDGLSLAYAYLSARGAGRPGGRRAAVLTRRLDAVELPRRAVLFRVEPGGQSWADVAARAARDEREGRDGRDQGEGEEGDEESGAREAGGSGGGREAGGKHGAPEAGGRGGGREAGGEHGAREAGGQGGAAAPPGEAGKARQAGTGQKAAPHHAGRSRHHRLPLLAAGEEAWVRGGGRLVLAVADDFGPLAVERVPASSRATKVFPLWSGVSRLRPSSPRALAGPPLQAASALWLAGDAVLVARLALGAGDVVLLACPEVFSNKLLGEAKADHLALLEALAGLDEPRPRPVYFDERAHGTAEGAGIVEIASGWGLGPLLLLLLLAAGAAFWRAAVRIGPPDRDDRDQRSEAVELLDSLADLYDRALGRGDALRLYHESLVRTVAAESGLKGAPLLARVSQLAPGFAPDAAVAGRSDLTRAAFNRGLQTLNDAFRRWDDAKRR